MIERRLFFSRLSLLVLSAALALACAATGVNAQAGSADPLGQIQPLTNLEGFGGGSGGNRVSLTAEVTAGRRPGDALLHVTATLSPNIYTYSVTQQQAADGGPKTTQITLEESSAYQLAGHFEPNHRPKVEQIPADADFWKGLDIEKHFEEVTWTAPLTLADGVDVTTLQVGVVCELQTCEVDGGCVNHDPFSLVARYSGRPTITPVVLEGADRGEGYRVPADIATIYGYIEPGAAEAGQVLDLTIIFELEGNYHVYQRKDVVVPDDVGQPTLIVITDHTGMYAGMAQTNAEAHESAQIFPDTPPDVYHSGQVVWTTQIAVPADFEGETYQLTGILGYQNCTDNTCNRPEAVRFTVDVPVQDSAAGGSVPFRFGEGVSYTYASEAADKRAEEEWPTGLKSAGGWASQERIAGTTSVDNSSATPIEAGGPLLPLLGLAFLGGLILNLMPCVLPVIGLKLFAFMEQAGQSRMKTFMLNLWYSLGIISVFLLLAMLAIVFRLGWGGLFQFAEFNIAMAAVIFAMGLSFLGVWEIPIPGFIGTGKVTEIGQREGYEGAFAKGTITTLLATPCTGPLMGTALIGVLDRPPVEIMSIFAALGLGMASPYLLIGAFPRALSFLPKPGEWMNTFKQIMGFVLIGTVIYLLTILKPHYVVPTVSMLAGLGLACWWLGRIPAGEEGVIRLRALGEASLVAVLIGLGSFLWLAPILEGRMDRWVGKLVDVALEQELEEFGGTFVVRNEPWQAYTPKKLEWLLENDKPVLIDFTADWCQTCKVNEKFILHTEETERLLEELGIYTMVADWTHRDEAVDVTAKLQEFQSPQVPLYAIYSADGDTEPVLLTGTLTFDRLHTALREAGLSTETAVADSSRAPAVATQ